MFIDELAPLNCLCLNRSSFIDKEWSDCSKYIKELNQANGSSLDTLQYIIRIASQIKEYGLGMFFYRPFIVYTYIQEELLYNLANRPELHEKSLFVDEFYKNRNNTLSINSAKMGNDSLVWVMNSY